ncbi:YopX family protein [Salibacterium sp. K-3]
MLEPKFRYIVQHIDSGNIEVKHYYLNQIEQATLTSLSPAFLADYEMLSRDQYTGIDDEDDNEIYEGDIIYFTVFDIEDNDTQYQGVVTFAGGMFQLWKSVESEFYGSDGPFELYWVHMQDDALKLLGNIHENPELLEVKS